MEIITSNKGGRKLCYEGYAYTKKYENKSVIRWECTQRKGKLCKGQLTTDLLATMVKSVTEHSHDADHFAVSALKVRSEIKLSAKANRGKPGQIVADKMVNYPREVVVAAGNIDALKKTVRRAKKCETPKEPAIISDIPVPMPDEYSNHHNEPFLVYDNESAQKRVLIFATNDGLDLLSNADTWFMDGTHSTAPK